ncbi:hypothetical protein KKI24_24040 [bacterium]|nr:hypothetical protein [bacterium]
MENEPSSNNANSTELKSNSKKRTKYILLYFASGIILIIVAIVSVIPELLGGAEYLYNEASLTVLYAAVSLATAIITFGILGDSGALVKLTPQKGFFIQISGSAAGFVIFFYILSSGLNPYKTINVYLYKSKSEIMQPSDGSFEVTLSSRISQLGETSNGQIKFEIMRSEANSRLFIKNVSGQLWEIESLAPEKCVEEGNVISNQCNEIVAYIQKADRCISDFSISSHEEKPINTTLEIVIDTLKENLQNISVDLPVNIRFSDKLIEKGYHLIEFELERKNESARSVCEHLAAIENRFNWSQKKRLVKTFLSCKTMLVALPNETIKKEFKPCL